MRAKTIVPGLCTALVVLATGVPAHAQWQDRLPPFDQSGVSPGSLGILTMPGDPAPAWILDEPPPTAYELLTVGVLEEESGEQVRIDRGDAPDEVIAVRPDTSWFLDGQPVTRDEIPPGSEVRATFDLEGNERVARQVEALRPGSDGLADPTAPPVASEIPGAALDEPPPPVALPEGAEARPDPDR